MTPACRFPQRYMVSPCGFKEGFYDADKVPAGWTDCSDMSDNEVGQLMVRRMMNGQEKK